MESVNSHIRSLAAIPVYRYGMEHKNMESLFHLVSEAFLGYGEGWKKSKIGLYLEEFALAHQLTRHG